MTGHDGFPTAGAGRRIRRGAGSVRTGRHLRYPQETPMTNLLVSLLDRMGVRAETLGDSKGKLEGLSDL